MPTQAIPPRITTPRPTIDQPTIFRRRPGGRSCAFCFGGLGGFGGFGGLGVFVSAAGLGPAGARSEVIRCSATRFGSLRGAGRDACRRVGAGAAVEADKAVDAGTPADAD